MYRKGAGSVLVAPEGNVITPLLGSWRKERWCLTALVFAAYGLYFPLTRYAKTLDPVDVSTSLDAAFPLWSSWMIAYMMIYPTAFLPLFVVRDPIIYRRACWAYLAVEATAFFLFVAVPVHMTLRPQITDVPAGGLFDWAVKMCYWFDPPTCCLPSLHVAVSALSAFVCLKADRTVGMGATLVAVLIAVSTLLVKQHFLADVFLGGAIAYLFYFVWVRSAKPLEGGIQVHSRWWLLFPVGVFASIVLGAYGLYQSGWEPWSQ